MSNVEEIQGYSILVLDVSKAELDGFDMWLHNETSWYGTTGWTCYPSDQEGRVILRIDSSLSGTWRGAVYPAFVEYWGPDRVINEVQFSDKTAETIALSKPAKKGHHKVLANLALFNHWKELGRAIAERGGGIVQNDGALKDGALTAWGEDLQRLCKQVQELYDDTFRHVEGYKKL